MGLEGPEQLLHSAPGMARDGSGSTQHSGCQGSIPGCVTSETLSDVRGDVGASLLCCAAQEGGTQGGHRSLSKL